jgi:transcriptional regulator with XRE-family HTH domain
MNRGQTIRTARTSKDLTQGDLGKAIGVTGAYIAMLEANRRRGDAILVPLARALGLDPGVLYDAEAMDDRADAA